MNLQRDLQVLLESHSIDMRLKLPSRIIASYLVNSLQALQICLQQKHQSEKKDG